MVPKCVLFAYDTSLDQCPIYIAEYPIHSVSCRNLYSFVVYLYVNVSGSTTSVGEERANLSAAVYL